MEADPDSEAVSGSFICDDEKCPKFSDDFEHKVKLTIYIVIDKEQQL
jgi:hypothetical protein